MYSDISSLIIAFSSLKSCSANALASSVFPTPVGPKNKNDPIGRLGSLSHALARLIARLTLATAVSCPTTRCWSTSSRTVSFAFSDEMSLETGIPVHLAITLATSSADTLSSIAIFQSCFIASSFASSCSSCLVTAGICSYLI